MHTVSHGTYRLPDMDFIYSLLLTHLIFVGNIIYANVLGVHLIILNSLDVATDMLNRKGVTYSDRPISHFMGELVGWKDVMTNLNDGPQLREQRRLFAQTFGSRAALTVFEPTLEGHTRNCIREILQSPVLDRTMVTEHARR
jgi:cytochrome P450